MTEHGPASSTVVWTGRNQGAVPGGLDGWNTSPRELSAVLEQARELVIVDALSFPWRNLPTARRDVPLTVTLPGELDAQEIVAVLGRPLLRHLTRYDRLVTDRSDVRVGLGDLVELPRDVWATGDAIADDPPRHVLKARLYEAVAALRAQIRQRQADYEDQLLVGFVGRATALASQVSATAAVKFAIYPAEPGVDPLATATGELVKPSPHVVVVWLDDGDQSSEDRKALLSRSFDLLHPGGVLLLLGYVVTAPGRPVNPSISRLVDELSAASSGLIHVDEIQSIRWGGEGLSRGVLVAATSLRVGRI